MNESNYFTAKGALLSHLAIPSSHIHPIRVGRGDAALAARRYAEHFPAAPDLMLLGVGEDGHTASIFPGSPSVRERTKRFVATESPVPPLGRITITPVGVRNARQVLVLVSGARKRDAVTRVFAEGGDVTETPAFELRRVTWFFDSEASGSTDATADITRKELS